MHDMQDYVVSEFIEDYEDGILARADLEQRLVGIVGASEAANLLAGGAHRRPPRAPPRRHAPPHPGRRLYPDRRRQHPDPGR